MPITPQLPAWAGPAPSDVTNIVDLQRMVQQLQTAIGLPAGSISGSQLAAGTVTSSNIAAGTITAGNIAAGAITAAQIAAGTITATQIAASTIVASNLAANSVTAVQLSAGSVTAAAIAANSVNASAIQAGAVGTTQLAANAVAAGNIASGAVTATKISVSSLSAVSATMGTVTGGIFQTGTSGSRVMFGTGMTTPSGITTGVVGTDTGNNVTFSIDANTGNVVLKGNILTGSTGLGNIGGLTQNVATTIAGGNLVDNPNLATNTTSQFTYSNASGAYNTTTYNIPPASLAVTASSTAAYALTVAKISNAVMLVTAGLAYSAASFVLTPSARSITPSITWYDSSGNVLSTSTGSAFTTIAGQWVRVNIDNQAAPSNAVGARVTFTGTGHAANEVHYYEEFIFIQQVTAIGATVIANSITATEINVSSLSAISANLGTVTAGSLSSVSITAGTIGGASITGGTINGTYITGGTITGTTITGGTIQTGTTGARIVINSNTLYSYDSSGSQFLQLDGNMGLSLRGANNNASTFSNTTSLSWDSGTIGSAIAGFIQGGTLSNYAQVLIGATSNGNYNNDTNYHAALAVSASTNGGVSAVGVNVGNYTRQLLQSDGTSDVMGQFPQSRNYIQTGVVGFNAPQGTWIGVGWNYPAAPLSQYYVYATPSIINFPNSVIYWTLAYASGSSAQVNFYSTSAVQGYMYFMVVGY